MISDQDNPESYGLSDEDKRNLKSILDRRKRPSHEGGKSSEEGDIPAALKDDIGVELIEYALEEDKRYVSSQNIASSLETDASNRQVGHRIRMIGDSLGVDKEDLGRFYSSSTTWDLESLRDNNLKELYEQI